MAARLMYEPDVDYRHIDKDVMIGMVICALISLVILTCMSLSFIKYSRKNKSLDKRTEIYTICHQIGNIIFCSGAAFYRCDLIFPIRYNLPNTLHPNYKICRLTVSIPFSGYYISKIFLYLLFLRRMEHTFKGSVYAMNQKNIYTMQCIIVFTLCASMSIFLIFESFQYCQTEDETIQICSVCTEDPYFDNIGGMALVCMSGFDLFFGTFSLLFFVSKLNKLIQSHIQSAVDNKFNAKYRFMSEDIIDRTITKFEAIGSVKALMGISLKCCVLCFVAVITNWLFLFVGETFVSEIGWFLCLDCLINGMCVFLFYGFNDWLFQIVCCPIVILFEGLAQCMGFSANKMYQRKMKGVISDSYNEALLQNDSLLYTNAQL